MSERDDRARDKYGTLARLDGLEPDADPDIRACLESRYVSLRFGELAVQVPYDPAIAATLNAMPGREYDDRPAFKEWRIPAWHARRLRESLPRIEAKAGALERGES